MKSFTLPQGFVLVLKKGEKLVESLLAFCAEQSIKSGWISGLGAVLEAELGYYHLDTQQYEFTKLTKTLEIDSLTGNITELEGQAFAHLHTVLSDQSLQTYGGHLKEAVVGGTAEIYLQPFQHSLKRQADNNTGLKLIT